MAKNSQGNNYTTITRNNGDGTQTERAFATRQERQLYLRTRHNEHRPTIQQQVRTVEHTGSDAD